MKKYHKEFLHSRLPHVLPKLRELLDQAGLEDFGLLDLRLEHNDSRKCNDDEEPCLIPIPNGYKKVCVAKGTCK
jgi:hypothetical protein